MAGDSEGPEDPGSSCNCGANCAPLVGRKARRL